MNLILAIVQTYRINYAYCIDFIRIIHIDISRCRQNLLVYVEHVLLTILTQISFGKVRNCWVLDSYLRDLP